MQRTKPPGKVFGAGSVRRGLGRLGSAIGSRNLTLDLDPPGPGGLRDLADQVYGQEPVRKAGALDLNVISQTTCPGSVVFEGWPLIVRRLGS